jgi:hypothetical protein
VSLVIGIYFSVKAVQSLLQNEPVRVLTMLGAGKAD